MAHLLFPGRHIVTTEFQRDYLTDLLGRLVQEMQFIGQPPQLHGDSTIDSIVFAITSSNLDNSRYNPVSYDKRVMGVDRFAMQLADETLERRRKSGIEPGRIRHTIVGIPDYSQTERFAEIVLKEIQEQTA